ncbi:MAG: response regulator transcription factor [Vulcanimicrobiaceae bacterium]
MIRTLVCATSEFARAGLAAIVRGDARLAVAGETAPGGLAAGLRALDPDVILEERAAAAAALATPSVALVDDPVAAWTHARDARGAPGAHAILARDAAPEEIVAAIVAVAAGLVAVQPRTLAFPDAARAPSPDRLTGRELEILGELARGVPNKTIAARLGISEHTVKFHVAAIFAKLAVASRTEAVTRGVRLGLIML